MEFRTVLDASQATVFLEGRLSFNSYPDFREATTPLLNHPTVLEIHLDMAAVEYLDSSALGMILHLNQKAIAHKKSIAITRPSAVISTTLKVVNFDKLVTILP